ncbi:MAG: ribosome maturation factor RimM [Ignavibacteria bacterium]|nr:ribosome maturation factor RimM [Ignavibacteria bacterium]
MSSMIIIGKIVATYGLHGIVKVESFTDFQERFSPERELNIHFETNEVRKYVIESSFFKKNMVYIKLKGIDSLEQAEQLLKKNIFIEEKDLKQLDENTYYIHDIVGLQVIDEKDHFLGQIVQVFKLKSNDVYEVVTSDKKRFLIPAVLDFIDEINIKEGFLRLKNSEGISN